MIPAKQASCLCVNCSKFPAKCYCTTCHKLLCPICVPKHETKTCNIESCDVKGIKMMNELITEIENQSNNNDAPQTMKNTMEKMRELFKWVEKETLLNFRDYQKKISKNAISNETKMQMKKLSQEQKFTDLYLMCLNIKENKIQNEKNNNSEKVLKEYQEKIQIIYKDFLKKFTAINFKINTISIFNKAQNQIINKMINSEIIEKPIIKPTGEKKVEGILWFFIKNNKNIEIKDEILKNKWYQEILNKPDTKILISIFKSGSNKNIDGQSLSYNDVIAIFEALKKKKSIMHLDLSINFLI